MNTRKTQILVALFLAISTFSSTAQAFSMSDVLALITGSNVTVSEDTSSTSLDMTSMIAESTPSKNGVAVTHRMYTVEVSGYNSEVGQTDASPFITASGTHVRDGIVASNMFPFGTVIKIPKLYGDKIFVVEDRMNKRYQNNVDIWFTDHGEALKLGRRTVQIEVIK